MAKRLLSLSLLLVVAAAIFVTARQSSSAPAAKGKDRVLSKVTFIHFRRGNAKPPWAGGGNDNKEPAGSYSFIAKGAKWRITEPVLINPACDENPDGSLDDLIVDATLGGLNEWETADDASLAIFGDLIIDDSVTYDDGAYRGYNTISFGPYSNPGVIAVTTVWGYLTGPPSQREIVEAHILMNDDFEWGDATTDALLMDVQNIITHELGHWAGMGDVYESTATEETMYGYSSEGETKKRDLYYGDITGICELYK
jgi:hypothetical protein